MNEFENHCAAIRSLKRADVRRIDCENAAMRAEMKLAEFYARKPEPITPICVELNVSGEWRKKIVNLIAAQGPMSSGLIATTLGLDPTNTLLEMCNDQILVRTGERRRYVYHLRKPAPVLA